MKYKKIFITILTVCALQFSLVGCEPKFEGNSVKNADCYELDIENMNGMDSHTLELEQGDTLQVHFEAVKGSLSMEIKAPDGSAIYQGDGTEATEFDLDIPADGAYTISVEGKKAQGSIRLDVEKAPEATEPATSEPESAESESATSDPEPEISEPEPVISEQEPAAVTAEELIGPWDLAENEKDNATAIEAISGAMEFGSSMEITGDGHISWYIGAEGGTGTYSLNGNVLSADMTNDFDGSPMKMEFTAEETDGIIYLYTEYKGLLLCWSQGEGETGKGQEPESEESYPGADVVELVNLRGDKTTAYKLTDGTYMDRIQRRFTYNGTDTWTDGDGVEWNEVAKDETAAGQEPESEESYPGADVVELVNLRGDETTVYKLADGTYMDRIERRFTYNGTDTWTDEDGVEWNEAVE